MKKYKDIIYSNITYKNNAVLKKRLVEQFKKNTLNSLLGSTCSKIVVKGTYNGAKELAIKKTDFELSLIKLYGYYNDSSNRMCFGIKGETISTTFRTILGNKLDGTDNRPSYESVGNLMPFTLGKRRRNFMNKNYFEKAKKLIKENDIEFNKRILNAVYWYSKAYDIPETKKVEDKKARTGSLEEVEYFN